MSEKKPANSDQPAKADATFVQPAKADANCGQPTEAEVMENDYQRHVNSAENAKLEYKEIYRQMAGKISDTQLEPILNIMAESENMEVENREEIAVLLRNKFLQEMEGTLDLFWKNYNVTNGLVSRAMLIDKFSSFEGTNWSMVDKKPCERTLPMRMYLKETMKRHLIKQIEFQKGLLAEKMKEIAKTRALIHENEKQRIILKEAMEKQAELFIESQVKMLKMQLELFNIEQCNNADDKTDHKPDDKADDKASLSP